MTEPLPGFEPSAVDIPPATQIWFFAAGLPQTKGSMRAFMPKGHARPILTNDCKKEKGWRSVVTGRAEDAMAGREPFQGPLVVVMDFSFPRPKGHFGAKGLKASAPPRPAVKPDADKVARSVGDALNGIVYRDDAQIVELVVRKLYTTGIAGVTVTVRPFEGT